LADDAYIRPTVLKAAVATSAASSFFEPVVIDHSRYIDGAFGANNPVNEVWREAQNIWCDQDGTLEPLISCFVSIGTRHPGVEPMHESAFKTLNNLMVKLATETGRTDEAFEDAHRGLVGEQRYFQFNVEQGLQDVGLEEHEKVGKGKQATDDYLAMQKQKRVLNECVDRLKQKRGMRGRVSEI
jgi:hypothetical protein